MTFRTGAAAGVGKLSEKIFKPASKKKGQQALKKNNSVASAGGKCCKMKLSSVIRRCLFFWRSILVVLLPLVLLPLAVVPQEEDDGESTTLAASATTSKCAYVGLLMAFSWMMELLPLAVTALIPVALFPIMGIMTTKDVSMQYMTGTCMLFVGGL
jgi:hypothetical protein